MDNAIKKNLEFFSRLSLTRKYTNNFHLVSTFYWQKSRKMITYITLT